MMVFYVFPKEYRGELKNNVGGLPLKPSAKANMKPASCSRAA